MALGAPPFIDPDTNGNPLLEWSKQNGQLHPALLPVIQKVQALGGAAPAAAPSPTLAPPQPPTPALTGAAPRPATPTPLSAGSPVPAAPAQGPNPSPAKAELARLTHVPQPGEAHTKADTGASGIGQIHNPWARIPLSVLDAVGSAFLPSLTMGLPGTQLHHELLTNEARGNVTEEANVGEKEAQTQHLGAQTENQLAEAQARRNPTDKLATNEVELFQKDAAKAGAFMDMKQAHEKAAASGKPEIVRDAQQNILGVIEGNGKYHSASDPALDPEMKKMIDAAETKNIQTETIKRTVNGVPHNVLVNKTTGQDIADMGEEARQTQGEVVNREIGGKPHNILVDKATGKDIADLGERGRNEPAENAGTWTFAVNGNNENVLVNTKTGQVRPAPEGVHKQSGFVESRQAQGKVIQTAGDALLQSIEKNRGKLGNIQSYWNQFINGTPIADPDTAGLMAQIGSFAALQPALHGFRGQQALAEFGKIIGGVPKNADALEAAIKAVQGTARIVSTGGTEPQGGANEPPPKTAEGGYQIGHKYGGMVYQGGPVNDKANWK